MSKDDDDVLEAEIRLALEARPDKGSTHWYGCAVERRHGDCAIAFLLRRLDEARGEA